MDKKKKSIVYLINLLPVFGFTFLGIYYIKFRGKLFIGIFELAVALVLLGSFIYRRINEDSDDA